MTNYKTSTDKHVMEFNRLELNISMKKKIKKGKLYLYYDFEK